MAEQETLLERLIPGDLEHRIPAYVQKALPGGFKNRIVQAALWLMISFGFAFLVRRMLEKREAKRAALAPPPPSPAIVHAGPGAPSGEPRRSAVVAQPMTEPAPSPAPAPAERSDASESRARRYPLLAAPHIHLAGPVDHQMYASFREQLANAPREGTLVVAISTLGGDPEVARLMGDELRLMREYSGREMLFLGKVAVYSAGATFMASFPNDKRFLTRETRIMVHERIITKTIHVAGPLKSCIANLQANLHEIEHSILIEEEGFRDLVAGSKISLEEVRQRAPSNWYIDAVQARDLGLVLDVI